MPEKEERGLRNLACHDQRRLSDFSLLGSGLESLLGKPKLLICLDLQPPSKKNQYFIIQGSKSCKGNTLKRSRLITSKAVKTFERELSWWVKLEARKLQLARLENPAVYLGLQTPGDKRRMRDVDSALACVLDALEASRLIENDREVGLCVVERLDATGGEMVLCLWGRSE